MRDAFFVVLGGGGGVGVGFRANVPRRCVYKLLRAVAAGTVAVLWWYTLLPVFCVLYILQRSQQRQVLAS